MRITTKTGDRGETGLFAGPRVSKASPLIDLMGEIDELQCFLGLAKFNEGEKERKREGVEVLERVQGDLYRLMSIVGFNCKPPMEIKDIVEEDVQWLESVMEGCAEVVGDLNQFVLPGKTLLGARLHTARAVCRRVERRFVACEEVSHEWGLKYLNRLSDLLFVLAYCEEVKS